MGIENLSYLSSQNYDRVLFSQIYNTSVPNTVGTYTLNFGDTQIGGYGRPLGVYSYDGSTTFNDFVPQSLPGGSLLSNSNSAIRPAVFLTPFVDGGGNLTFKAAVKATVGGGGTIPLEIRIAILAVDSPSATESTPTQSNVNKLAYSSIDKGTPTQYRQISSAGAQTSGSTPTVFTIPHGLGVVPNIQIWQYDGSKNTIASNFWEVRMKPINSNNGAIQGVALDASNIYVSPLTAVAASQTLYRTYKEN